MSKKVKLAVISIGFRCDEWINEVWDVWANTNSDIYISFIYGITPENRDNGFFIDKGDSRIYDKIVNVFKNKPEFTSQFITIPYPEYELRNIAINRLRELDIDFDYLMILDADDEFYTKEDVERIISHIYQDPFISCYRIPFCNYINLNGNIGFYCGFSPPRIWSNHVHSGIDKFMWDNDISYKNGVYQNVLSIKTLPLEIKHNSWCGSEERLQRKINYQTRHFAHGAGCGYIKAENGVDFNPEYYAKTNEKKPFIEFEKE
jgi:hypothetical protein